MLYRIFVTGPGACRASVTRKRSDAAILCAQRLAYDSIKGQAGLDTQWGLDAMSKVRNIDPQRGATIPLRDYTLFFTCDRSGARI